MASEGDEKCPGDLTSVEKIFFRNGRNPTWISANISNSYVLNKFSLWFGGFRGPERENRQKNLIVRIRYYEDFRVVQIFIAVSKVTANSRTFPHIAIFSRVHEI